MTDGCESVEADRANVALNSSIFVYYADVNERTDLEVESKSRSQLQLQLWQLYKSYCVVGAVHPSIALYAHMRLI